MQQLDEMIELGNQITEASGRSFETPRPSEATIRATEEALGFVFPPSFRRYIAKSRYYCFEDVDHPTSLVRINQLMRDRPYYLPDFLILFMGGHDGDCHCFDSRFRDEDGECAVVYWDAEEWTEKDIEGLETSHANFAGFLESIIEHELKRL